MYAKDRWKYHHIENVVARQGNDSREFWWQSENGVQEVSIRLDLEAEFHFSYLVLEFQTFRPAAMIIERSSDRGLTWKAYQYFAYNCSDSFPGVPKRERLAIEDVICEDKYSNVEPSKFGEVIFKVLPPSIRIDDPYSGQVQDLLRITNLRINFTRLHTLGDNLLDPRVEIQEKYFYAINKMVVGGACFCYGHASKCVSEAGMAETPGMVYGKCECNHHTKGMNCEQCDDFYNDAPWRPAIGAQVNACKRCECHGHSSRCAFNETVYKQNGGLSGGVCLDCAHNTAGIHCEQCSNGFFRNSARSIEDPSVCERKPSTRFEGQSSIKAIVFFLSPFHPA